MAIKIKNIDSSSHTWGGKLYAAGELYTTQSEEDVRRYGFDSQFLSDLNAALAEVYDEALLLTNYADAVYLLQTCRLYTPQDDEHKPYFNLSMTKLDWYYSPHSLDFYTSKNKSLYNRRHDGAGIDDGTDMGDAWLRFYDEAGDELAQSAYESDEEFQARLTANCVKTVMSWEKEEAFDVVGAYLYVANSPSGRAYLWVIAAPDIPYEYGGSKPFMGRGMNLQMMKTQENHYFDAKSTKTVNYDPVYHSGKVDCVVKHQKGDQIGIQLIYICYEE